MLARVAEMIARHFGVQYTATHVWRLLMSVSRIMDSAVCPEMRIPAISILVSPARGRDGTLAGAPSTSRVPRLMPARSPFERATREDVFLDAARLVLSFLCGRGRS